MSLAFGDHCFSSLLLFTEQDAACVHPDDLPAVRARYPHGWQLLCFRYGGQDHGYDVLYDGELRARVRGAVIRPIPAPRFRRTCGWWLDSDRRWGACFRQRFRCSRSTRSGSVRHWRRRSTRSTRR